MRWRKKRPSPRSDPRVAHFNVTGMSCGSCVARIEQVLAGQDGVDDASVDLESGEARVGVSSAASIDDLIAAVAEAGYTMTPRA